MSEEREPTQPDARARARISDQETASNPASQTEGTPSEESRAPESEDGYVGTSVGGAVLRQRIGVGGMGVVYEAWQEPPGRTVAVKLLRDGLASDEQRFRFRHEAHILASLKHPGIAQIYSAGTHSAATEMPYFLMEHIAGARSITDHVSEEKLPLEEALALGARVCRGVQAGHARGVIHRDLKPANILVDPDGNPKVIDFGIARMQRDDGDEQTPRTNTGQIMGTVPYMSPEQFLGDQAEVATGSDVYALGVVLYEMLTGRLPYDLEGLGLIDAIRTIQDRTPEPPARLRPELAGDVSVILLKALAKDPAERYASAEALAEDIDRFLEQLPILARPPSLTYQIRLYARRRKAAFYSMLGVAVTIVVALIAISVFAAGESRARARAEREEARAVALLHVSASFIPEVADHLDNKLGAILGTARVRNLLAQKLEALAATLAAIEGAGGDAEVAHAVGAAELAIARIRGGAGGTNLGEGTGALPHFLRAVEQFERASDAHPENDAFLDALLDARLALADQYSSSGHVPEARAALAGVDAPLRGWLARAPGNTVALGRLIDLQAARGLAEWRAGDTQASLSAYTQGLALTQAFPWDDVEIPGRGRASMLLRAHLNLATGLVAAGRAEEAGAHFQKINTLSKALEEGGSAVHELEALWHVHDKLGDFALDNGMVEEGQGRHERALAVAQRLSAGDPNNAGARVLVRVSRGALGRALEKGLQFGAARHQHQQVLKAVREEFLREPTNRVLEWDLRVALTRLSSVESREGARDSARQHLEEALGIQLARVQALPGNAEERAALAEVEYTDALLLLAPLGDEATPAQEIAAYRQGRARLQSAVDRLKRLRAEGTLAAQHEGNIAPWDKLIAYLGEALKELEAGSK